MYKGRQDIDGKTGASLGHLVPSRRVPPLCPMTSAARPPAPVPQRVASIHEMSPAAAKYTRETCEETVQTLCGGGNGIKKSSQKIGDAPYRFTFQFPRISPENVGGAH
jgi:hypothetical protein